MRIHLYDFLNKNKKAILYGEDFTSINISHNIDDFSSASFSATLSERIVKLAIQGFENIYIEDDDGNIIFGGIITGFSSNSNSSQINAYDHRWVLTRLVLDQQVTILSSDNILEKIAGLIAQAKAKRQIPIEFDIAGSAINSDFRADLKFEIGEDIGGCMQKIIQTIYARWAVRYRIVGNEIYGNLVIRSVNGVSPQGVGISRTINGSEDGEVITLLYAEGKQQNNIQEYSFVFDLSSYSSRAKVGARIGNEPKFFTAPPNGNSALFEGLFGLCESYVSDYNANSDATANAVSSISQTYPRQDLDVTLVPHYTRLLNCGDRVNIVIESPMLEIPYGYASVRIDSINYQYRDGFFERRVQINTMSPQKRTGTTGLLQAINSMKQKIDGLDKNYLNNPAS